MKGTNLDIPRFSLCLFLLVGLMFSCQSKDKGLALHGEWKVVLDSLDQGEKNLWFESFPNGKTIELPGTLDQAGLGTEYKTNSPVQNEVFAHLTRQREYIGKAWYQREIDISSEWANKALELNLERVIWSSKVWINGVLIGDQMSLVGFHKFKIENALKSGKNTITICIDNSNKYPLINIEGKKYEVETSKEMAHAYTNHTQIKWNGIIGEISLKPLPKISNLRLQSDIKNNELLVTADLDDKLESKHLKFKITANGQLIKEGIISHEGSELNNYSIELGSEFKLWDELNPNLYEFEIWNGNASIKQTFGMREISSNNGTLTLNGQRIFLRGTLECAVFPLTGYPPTDKEAWRSIISTAKSFGFNHFRFHSWCPPKAAFEAADELGFYLQAELPHWNLQVGSDPETNRFLENEAEIMLKEYGNHPSFILMALGNELEGDISYMNSFVNILKKKDNRRLYTTTSFSFQKGLGSLPQPADDFFVTQWTDKGWIRGQGIFNDQIPHFDKNYEHAVKHIQVPIISHEIGQYSVYPDLSEIDKYTGVLKPLNFIAIKNDLEQKGLLELAPQYTYASGKLAALLYKEEIERALKTPGFDGFQLLQLQDFPGQGTALVGLLNVFWDSKGIIDDKAFSRFNKEIVPLINMPKAVYTAGEKFHADIQIANFYKSLQNQTVKWTIQGENTELASGKFENINLLIGNENYIGQIGTQLEVENAEKLEIIVEIENSDYFNSWSVWVYPKQQVQGGNSKYTRSLNQALKWLSEGHSVLLNPELDKLKGVEGRFVPVFWSPVHFPDQPATMGILCDPKHQAFSDFPTDSHTDWQWWDLCKQSKSLDLDGLEVEPIVRVIDNFLTNRELTNVFEAKVGKGKLIFTSIDLQNNLVDRPVANQMRNSLENYMNSSQFNPKKEINDEDLKILIDN